MFVQISMQQQSTVRPSAVRIIIICIHGTWTMPYVLILIINQRLNDSSDVTDEWSCCLKMWIKRMIKQPSRYVVTLPCDLWSVTQSMIFKWITFSSNLWCFDVFKDCCKTFRLNLGWLQINLTWIKCTFKFVFAIILQVNLDKVITEAWLSVRSCGMQRLPNPFHLTCLILHCLFTASAPFCD